MPPKPPHFSDDAEQENATRTYLQRAAERSPLWAAVLEKEDLRKEFGQPANDDDFLNTEQEEPERVLLPLLFIVTGLAVTATVALGAYFDIDPLH